MRMTEWKSIAVLMRGGTRDDGKVLGVLVQTEGAPVLALETENPNGSTLDIFAGHAHAVVLEHPKSLSEAIEAAELYLVRWLNHELEEHKNCDCETIGTPPPKTQKTPSRSGSKRRSRA